MRRFLLGISLVLALGSVEAQTSADLREWGSKFAPSGGMEFKVPAGSFTRLPLQVGAYTAEPTPFKREAVEWLVEKVFTGAAAREEIKRKIAEDVRLIQQGRTVLKTDEEARFVVSAESGSFMFTLQPGPSYNIRRLPVSAEQTNSVAPERFHATLRQLLSKFDLAEREIERKPDGGYHILFSDTQTYPNHQKDPVLYARSVTYSRCIEGFPMASAANAYQIEMERFVAGPWKRLYVNWPKLHREGERRTYRSNEELRKAVEAGKALWDFNNEVAPAEVKQITVTEIRLVYCTAKNGRSEPVLCLDAEMKKDDGTEYGVLFLPLQ